MGNKTSQLEAQLVGYRVLGVQPFSPAAKAGLVSFFDFIIACNNVLMRDLDANFVDIIQVIILFHKLKIYVYKYMLNCFIICRLMKINLYY